MKERFFLYFYCLLTIRSWYLYYTILIPFCFRNITAFSHNLLPYPSIQLQVPYFTLSAITHKPVAQLLSKEQLPPVFLINRFLPPKILRFRWPRAPLCVQEEAISVSCTQGPVINFDFWKTFSYSGENLHPVPLIQR